MNSSHTVKKKQNTILNILVFLYILCVFTLNTVPEYSRLDFYISVLIMLVLIVKYLHSGTLHIPKLICLPWFFLFFSMSSIIWAYNPSSAFNIWIALFLMIISASTIWIALENGASVKIIVIAMAFASFIIVLSTVYEILFTTEYVTRYTGILNNPNLLAILLSLIGLFMIGLYSHNKIVVLYSFSIIIFATIYSGSRKIVFTWIVLGILLLIKSNMKVKKSTIFLVTIVLIAIIIAFAYFSSDFLVFFDNLSVVKRFERLLSGTDQYSADVRGNMIKEGFQFWQDHIWFGNGLGQFSELSMYKKYSHNNYIETLSGLGIIGLLFYYMLYFYLVFKSITQFISSNKGSAITISMIFLFFLWDFALVSYIEQFTWIILVILLHLTTHQKKLVQQKAVKGAEI
ncbi:O-antigen ligase family protein [Bacillus massiliigorillae]|uniref:O-antigen ligase family protein n=1 Tax=Bacillus massiliigorillae TaxID=1243664 RepID=UPI0003A9530A|nr:O-antigen ligase family protein [Bacillus massiliigorillae]